LEKGGRGGEERERGREGRERGGRGQGRPPSESLAPHYYFPGAGAVTQYFTIMKSLSMIKTNSQKCHIKGRPTTSTR